MPRHDAGTTVSSPINLTDTSQPPEPAEDTVPSSQPGGSSPHAPARGLPGPRLRLLLCAALLLLLVPEVRHLATSALLLLPSIVLVLVMGLPGVVALRQLGRGLQPLEQVAYGLPLGVVVASLVTLALATVDGRLTTVLVVSIGVAACLVTVALWPQSHPNEDAVQFNRDRLQTDFGTWPALALEAIRRNWSLAAVLVIGVFALRWIPFWMTGIHYQDGALWTGQRFIWQDFALHLGHVASFAYSDNFPPQNPREAGYPFAYHYLTAFTVAMFVKIGLDPVPAIALHSYLFSVMLALCVYAFARRLTQDRAAGLLALVLYLLGGGIGWVLTIGTMITSHDILGTLLNNPWDVASQQVHNFWFWNMYIAFFEPQVGYYYGLPLGLLTVTLLILGYQNRDTRLFLVAGGVAGLLPIAHLSTLLTLVLLSPFLFLFFPSRRWIYFFAMWALIGLPQYFWQQGGLGTAAGLHWNFGWLAGNENGVWFWIKNLGWFAPLTLLALLARDLVPALSKRLLLAFMSLFVLANVVIFQPYVYDNTKFLVYWFLAASILCAALLVKIWRRYHSFVWRSGLALVVFMMVLSGLLWNLEQFLSRDNNMLLSAEEVKVAQLVRQDTPPRSVFLVGLQHNHPVPVLTGRTVVMSFPGWLWTYGIYSPSREQDVRDMYSFTPNTPALLQKYGVDYVVIGPEETNDLHANLTAYRARYPRVIQTANYAVFAVSPSARHAAKRQGSADG